MYDLIGDIHGHASELIRLLDHLGYRPSDSGYHHQTRRVIFLGDFIDRGEYLGEHVRLLNIVMKMVNNGHALAVMGNHEFNAMAYHTFHNGNYLRLHTAKNTAQHQAFLNEYGDRPESKDEVLDFFYSLPLWLELDGLRVVHACWSDYHINQLIRLSPSRKLNPELLVAASTPGTPAYEAIEILLKGFEVDLPGGVTFNDKEGHTRSSMRLQWWKLNAAELGDVALTNGCDIGAAARLAVPSDMPVYDEERKPCFIGHYWLDGQPAPLRDNVACLDYSVAKQGKLVAYRWDGEQILARDRFTFAPL